MYKTRLRKFLFIVVIIQLPIYVFAFDNTENKTGKSYLDYAKNNTGQSYSDSMNILYNAQKQVREQREAEIKRKREMELAKEKAKKEREAEIQAYLAKAQEQQESKLREELAKKDAENAELRKGLFSDNPDKSDIDPLVEPNFYQDNKTMLDTYNEAIGTPETLISNRVDRSRFVTTDQYIQVLLTTSLSTRRGGSVVLMVERDVYSKSPDPITNKYNILLPKGSTFICEYKPLGKQGQTSVDLQCVRGYLPDGRGMLFAKFPSASDEMGRAGVIGKVDNRLWERYGNAFIVAGLAGMTMYASSKIPDGAISEVAKYTTLGMMQTTQQLIQNSIDLAPIVSITAGTRLFIRPTEDIRYSDFSDYQNELLDEQYKENLFPSNNIHYGKKHWWNFTHTKNYLVKTSIKYGRK